MRFEQTHEILKHIQNFHASLSDLYQNLENKAARERTKLLLDYMGSQEQQLAAAIENFMQQGKPELLDAWFQFDDDAKLQEFCACPDINPDSDLSVDDVMHLAQQAYHCLTSTFENIINNCQSPRVSDVFQQLLDQARSKWKRLVQAANTLSDF